MILNSNAVDRNSSIENPATEMRYHLAALPLLLTGNILVKQARPFAPQQEPDLQPLQPRGPQKGGNKGSGGGEGEPDDSPDSKPDKGETDAASQNSLSGSSIVVAGLWIGAMLI